MPEGPSSRKRLVGTVLGVVALGLLAFGGYEVYKWRIIAGGMRNLVSAKWWSEHNRGEDLYNTNTRFLKRGNRGLHEVCLTFDDGPHPGSCEAILDALTAHKAQATFFLVGRRIKERPDLVHKILDGGFEVGNHTQDHYRLDTLNDKQVRAELENCDTNYFRVSGKHMTLFRPPGMRINDSIQKTVDELGYTTIGWDIGAKDFVGGPVKSSAALPKDEIAKRVIKQLTDGAIILLHDNPDTAASMPYLLDYLDAHGYKVVNASQMLAHLPHPVLLASSTGDRRM